MSWFAWPVRPTWKIIDVDALCRNWVTPASGTECRMTNRAEAIKILCGALNYVLARCPRVVFNKVLPFTDRQTTTPTGWLYRWLVKDEVDNALQREFRVLACPRETDSGSKAYWSRLDTSLAEDTSTVSAKYDSSLPASPTPEDITYEEAAFQRGAKTDTEDAEGVLTYENHTIVDICVQDRAYSSLDLADQINVGAGPRVADPCVGRNFAAGLRTQLHTARTTNLPMVAMWAAVGSGADFSVGQTANTGDETGVHITDETYFRNILRPSVAPGGSDPTHDANSPGWQSHVYRCGMGDPSTTAGKKLKVTLRILAKATTATGIIRCLGPISADIPNNTTAVLNGDIDITVGGFAWYGVDADVVYLDTSVSNSDTTAARAKIDVWGKAGSSGALFVYGFIAMAVWGA